MSIKKNRIYYNTPLNLSKTIDLPSNLLQAKSNTIAYQPNIQNNSLAITERQTVEPAKPKKQQNVMLVQEKYKSRKSALYKRLTDIKSKNQELEKYSYSKLLSKMVIVDPKQIKKSFNIDHDNIRTISQYSCLRGKLINMDCSQQKQQQPIKNKGRDRYSSRMGDSPNYLNRTTRIFKRYYMPNSQKVNPNFFNQSPQQKYIYINGKKTECKRIHNFYTSQNFRNSYDKAFGRTKDSFFSKKGEHIQQFSNF